MPILDDKNLELVDVEYVKEGPDWFLRVFIDKAGGINIEECGLVSGELSDKLDEADIVPGHYFLEVSSPGVERPLKTKQAFNSNVNNNIFVTLYVHIDGEKEYDGILVDFSYEVATIEFKIKKITQQITMP